MRNRCHLAAGGDPRADFAARPRARRRARAHDLRRGRQADQGRASSRARRQHYGLAAGEARRLTGESVPITGTQPGHGHIAWTVRVPIGVIGAITPFNFPLNLVAHKLAPALAAGAVVLKPASQTPVSALRSPPSARRPGLPPAGSASYRGGPRRSATCSSRTSESECSRSPARPRLAGISARGRGRRWRSSSGTLRRSRRAGRRPRARDREGGDARVLVRRPDLCLGSTGLRPARTRRRVPRRLVLKVEALSVGRSGRRRHRRRPGDRPGSQSGSSSGRGGAAGGAEVGPAGRGGRADPAHGPDGCRSEMKVAPGDLRSRLLCRAVRLPRGGFELANWTEYGLQAAIFTTSIDPAVKASGSLEFGSVMIQQAPGGALTRCPTEARRPRGTREEGRAYTVREMTEERLVVLGGV